MGELRNGMTRKKTVRAHLHTHSTSTIARATESRLHFHTYVSGEFIVLKEDGGRKRRKRKGTEGEVRGR